MAERDDALRPNQLLAITLGLICNADVCDAVLTACQALLVPGAIRSLADRPLKRPLEVRHNGLLINDPHNPYQGRYTGDEDTRRKPAYHNGTAWTWQFPSYCEAWILRYGDEGKATARALLYSSIDLIRTGCLGHIPEILDGNFPHTPRGCDAQAWGVSELLRVWLLAS
jgi:starch synthase (maltosyl-transferring)